MGNTTNIPAFNHKSQTFRNRANPCRFLAASEEPSESPTLTMNPALNPEFRCTISTSRTQSICIEEHIRFIQRRIHSYSFKPHTNTPPVKTATAQPRSTITHRFIKRTECEDDRTFCISQSTSQCGLKTVKTIISSVKAKVKGFALIWLIVSLKGSDRSFSFRQMALISLTPKTIQQHAREN